MESEPTDGKDVQAEASAPISESQTEALDTEAELSKLTPELQAKFKQLLAQETKHLSERTDSTGSVKEPPPKQQKIEVDDDFQAFLSFLPEIDLEWGDLDPNVQQKLRYSQQAREDFKALHHQKQEINTYDPETGHITTTQPKKRPFEEQYKPPEIEAADKQLQQAMMQYHEHQVLPGLQHLTECCQNFYGTVSQEILLLQHMTDRHSLQLRSLEQSRCNKTILLKNLPPVGFTKTQLDRNVQYLLNDANLTWDRLAAMHNHVVTTDAAVLRLEFLTEEDAKIFFQAMKRRKHHGFFNGQQEAKQPVEDRLALQPFYALIDMLSPHFGNDGTNALQMDKNTLQVWPGSEHQDQNMLAPVSYRLDPHAPRRYLCTVLIREDVHHILVRDFHAKFQNRMKATLQLTQALTRATQDRTTTARHAWQKSFDISNTPNPLKAFPYQIHFITISHDLIKLLETHPALPLQGTGGLTAVVAQAFADYGINVEDYGKGGSKGKSRPLQPPLSKLPLQHGIQRAKAAPKISDQGSKIGKTDPQTRPGTPLIGGPMATTIPSKTHTMHRDRQQNHKQGNHGSDHIRQRVRANTKASIEVWLRSSCASYVCVHWGPTDYASNVGTMTSPRTLTKSRKFNLIRFIVRERRETLLAISSLVLATAHCVLSIAIIGNPKQRSQSTLVSRPFRKLLTWYLTEHSMTLIW